MKIRNIMRARRIRKHRRRLDDQAHIAWAHGLIGNPRNLVNRHGQRFRQYDDGKILRMDPDGPVVIRDTDIQPDGLDVGPWHSNYERFS